MTSNQKIVRGTKKALGQNVSSSSKGDTDTRYNRGCAQCNSLAEIYWNYEDGKSQSTSSSRSLSIKQKHLS